jgi:hypothetical protein
MKKGELNNTILQAITTPRLACVSGLPSLPHRLSSASLFKRPAIEFLSHIPIAEYP